jgi:hypothetical protein
MSGSRALVTSKFNTPENKLQSDFRQRNHVAPSYRGPVYVVEDIYVPCALCRAPVDPVTRIPVGRLYFHPRCLRCSVCDKPAKDQAFAERNGQPVCNECSTRGFAPRRELASSQFSTRGAWESHSRSTTMHGSRTPISAMTERRLALEERQRALLLGDTNIRLLSSTHGDDPSQPVAYITNPGGLASRQGKRDRTNAAAATEQQTPAKQLLPRLTPSHAGSTSLRGHPR